MSQYDMLKKKLHLLLYNDKIKTNKVNNKQRHTHNEDTDTERNGHRQQLVLFVVCVFFICFITLFFGWMHMTQDELEMWIKQLIAENKLYKFYKCKEWRQLSDAIMKENNYECQHCKSRGFHTPARSVHHVQWVRRHPRLALSRTYVYNGVTYNNLIPLCEDCHNKEHEKGKGLAKGNKNKFANEERW